MKVRGAEAGDLPSGAGKDTMGVFMRVQSIASLKDRWIYPLSFHFFWRTFREKGH